MKGAIGPRTDWTTLRGVIVQDGNAADCLPLIHLIEIVIQQECCIVVLLDWNPHGTASAGDDLQILEVISGDLGDELFKLWVVSYLFSLNLVGQECLDWEASSELSSGRLTVIWCLC